MSTGSPCLTIRPAGMISRQWALKTPKELTKGNHPSLPHGQMPAFIAALRKRNATAALALELLILTNVRTNAILQAKWPEFVLDKALWNVPLVNLKDREHRRESFEVPLSSSRLLKKSPRWRNEGVRRDF